MLMAMSEAATAESSQPAEQTSRRSGKGRGRGDGPDPNAFRKFRRAVAGDAKDTVVHTGKGIFVGVGLLALVAAEKTTNLKPERSEEVDAAEWLAAAVVLMVLRGLVGVAITKRAQTKRELAYPLLGIL